jgi:hypothetical protein
MNIVAINNLGKDEETLSKALAHALGKTAYEARSRLRVPQGGPSIVAVFRGPGEADECAVKLRANGFETVVLREDEIESDEKRFLTRSFEFRDGSLRAESRNGESVAVPLTDVKLMLNGSGMSVRTGTEKITERKFNLGMAIATQGLVMSTKTTREVHTEAHTRERFLYLYPVNLPTLVLRENALLYDPLGAELKPSRAANFNYIVEELKRLCTAAVFDDRLLNRGNQVQLLGPLLTPEADLDIATSLLAVALQPPS